MEVGKQEAMTFSQRLGLVIILFSILIQGHWTDQRIKEVDQTTTRIETNLTRIENELINIQQDIAAIGQDSVHSTE